MGSVEREIKLQGFLGERSSGMGAGDGGKGRDENLDVRYPGSRAGNSC